MNHYPRNAKWTVTLFYFVALPALLQAQSFFHAIGFEGQTVRAIPNLPTTGVPTGVTGPTFNYNLLAGNNLQTFRSAAAGTPDSDDLGAGTSGNTSVPDYYKSPDFGWRLQGYVSSSLTNANWDAFQPSATGSGAAQGTDYPGAADGRTVELSEAININRFFSPATGNLAAAPGLGDQFLDVWSVPGTPGVWSAQLSINIGATQNTNWTGTFGFGGRDAASHLANGFFRLRDGNTVLYSGSTGDIPTEYWTAPATQGTAVASHGVTQTDWEYFKFSGVAVTEGKMYTLDLILPEEQNFDWVLGEAYTVMPGAVVPEPSSLLMSAGSLLGLMLRRRRK